MGSGTSTFISMRADNFARYVLLADASINAQSLVMQWKNFQHWRQKGEIS